VTLSLRVDVSLLEGTQSHTSEGRSTQRHDELAGTHPPDHALLQNRRATPFPACQRPPQTRTSPQVVPKPTRCRSPTRSSRDEKAPVTWYFSRLPGPSRLSGRQDLNLRPLAPKHLPERFTLALPGLTLVVPYARVRSSPLHDALVVTQLVAHLLPDDRLTRHGKRPSSPRRARATHPLGPCSCPARPSRRSARLARTFSLPTGDSPGSGTCELAVAGL
jgi:hypothetical protein